MVKRIHKASIKEKVEWKETQFYSICESILEDRSLDETLEKMYDEDLDLVREIAIIIQIRDKGIDFKEDLDGYFKFTRIYLPIIILILENYF